MKLTCILCGSEMGSYSDWWGSVPGDVAYFERGLSTNRFLCRDCWGHKTNLLNFEADEKTIIESEKYMKKYVEGKVSEIKNVVQSWIDGECTNYFPEMKDLMYYIEGPEAYLFVYNNRVIILSSVIDGLHGKTIVYFDAAMLFPAGENNGGFVLFNDDKNNIGDIKKLNYMPDPNSKYRYAHSADLSSAFTSLSGSTMISSLFGLEAKGDESNVVAYSMSEKENGILLEKSLGDYGSLDFVYNTFEETKFSFKFFYHQNQLMEEIYNYIQRRISLSGKDENAENSVEPVQIMSSRRRKAMESSVETSSANFSPAEEIGKLKGLLDCGAITQEEYDDAKKKLLAKL